jgi:hypothetical protein
LAQWPLFPAWLPRGGITEGEMMFYRKNVGAKERAARFLAGVLMIYCGLVWLDATLLGVLVAASGATTVLTGLFGYCPACAVAGRSPVRE